jgi:hypothetical protein
VCVCVVYHVQQVAKDVAKLLKAMAALEEEHTRVRCAYIYTLPIYLY